MPCSWVPEAAVLQSLCGSLSDVAHRAFAVVEFGENAHMFAEHFHRWNVFRFSSVPGGACLGVQLVVAHSGKCGRTWDKQNRKPSTLLVAPGITRNKDATRVEAIVSRPSEQSATSKMSNLHFP